MAGLGFHAPRSLPTDGRYVAARPFEWNGTDYAEGDLFPWREIGLAETTVQRHWWTGMLNAAPSVPDADSQLVKFTASPSEVVAVPPPARPAPQQHHKHRR